MQAQDATYEVPPAEAFGREVRNRRIPHIYTPDEITRLLKAASLLAPTGSIRPATYTTLFALVAATGLRISEAIALRPQDITPAGVIVRNTKFRKSRLVPLHVTTQHGLQRYLALRQQIGGVNNSLFVALSGKPICYETVCSVFLQLMRSIGLRGKPGIAGPRIHDLRHTFAVRALEQCKGGDVEVARHILALSTYLGHAHPSDTYWYLQATPKLLSNIASAGESLFEGGAT
jgi:integrase